MKCRLHLCMLDGDQLKRNHIHVNIQSKFLVKIGDQMKIYVFRLEYLHKYICIHAFTMSQNTFFVLILSFVHLSFTSVSKE